LFDYFQSEQDIVTLQRNVHDWTRQATEKIYGEGFDIVGYMSERIEINGVLFNRDRVIDFIARSRNPKIAKELEEILNDDGISLADLEKHVTDADRRFIQEIDQIYDRLYDIANEANIRINGEVLNKEQFYAPIKRRKVAGESTARIGISNVQLAAAPSFTRSRVNAKAVIATGEQNFGILSTLERYSRDVGEYAYVQEQAMLMNAVVHDNRIVASIKKAKGDNAYFVVGAHAEFQERKTAATSRADNAILSGMERLTNNLVVASVGLSPLTALKQLISTMNIFASDVPQSIAARSVIDFLKNPKKAYARVEHMDYFQNR
jgi:hypothetical protein